MPELCRESIIFLTGSKSGRVIGEELGTIYDLPNILIYIIEHLCSADHELSSYEFKITLKLP